MLLKLLIFFFLLFTFTLSLKAQKQNNQWRFGYFGGVDFNSNNPINITGSATATQEGSASVADRNTGALLFYTDGVSVWNSLNQLMPNGNGLLGGSVLSSTTAAAIIPMPGNMLGYYIVTIDDGSSGGGTSGLRYTEVDMNLNGGLGDVVPSRKNIFLLATATEKLEVAPASNGLDSWIITHDNTTFYSFRVTSAGIITSPVTSTVSGGLSNTSGHLKISRQLNKLACGSLAESAIRFFNFNNATGVISDLVSWTLPVSVINAGALIYGLEFSPNGEYFYFTNLNGIYQINIQSNSTSFITNSLYQISGGGQPASAQLGPDYKIYINNGNLAVINCPDLPGASCGYSPGNLFGGGYGLPKWVFDPKDTNISSSVKIVAQDSCLQNATTFSVADTLNILNISWLFGDPASGSINNASGNMVNHLFSGPGNYTIRAIITNSCGKDTLYLNNFLVLDCSNECAASIKFSSDTCVDKQIYFSINPPTGIQSQLWNFGETANVANNTSTLISPVHQYQRPGTYLVSLIITNPCGIDTLYQTIKITDCTNDSLNCGLFVPNVFSPNSDFVNDEFIPLSNCIFEKYELLIYNRWGELIFKTNDYNERWNGEYKNRECNTGVYAYTLSYKLPGQVQNKRKGSVNLIR